MTDRDRLIRYVEKFFVCSGRTAFPTVRRCSQALKLKIAAIEELTDEGWPLMLTSYHTNTPTPIADHFVEVCH